MNGGTATMTMTPSTSNAGMDTTTSTATFRGGTSNSSSEAIRRRLEEAMGVRPSLDWLDSCIAFLEESRKPVTADEVLYQILTSDLRDVVRTQLENDSEEDEHDNDTTLPPPPPPAAVQQLDQCLQRSLESANASRTNNTYAQQRNQNRRRPPPQQLSQNFKLLCQVEEVLDMSLNAETRLAVGPAAPSPQTAQNALNPLNVPSEPNVPAAPAGGNQRMRCLKLCLCHGHRLPRNNATGRSPVRHVVIAMENSPIANLSSNTLAGCKLVLHGPITIRFGVLVLHQGNTTILGGSNAEMVQIQRQALLQAKQAAGVGVDPTIRALIGTSPIGVDGDDVDGDEDEGLEASGDVPAQPTPAPAPQHLAINPVMNLNAYNQRNNNNNNHQAQRHMPPPNQPPVASISTAATTTTTTTTSANGGTNTYRNSLSVRRSSTDSASSSLWTPRSTGISTTIPNSSSSSLTFSPASSLVATTPMTNPYRGGGSAANQSSSSSAPTDNASTNPSQRSYAGIRNPYAAATSTGAGTTSSTANRSQLLQTPSTTATRTPTSTQNSRTSSLTFPAPSQQHSSQGTAANTSVSSRYTPSASASKRPVVNPYSQSSNSSRSVSGATTQSTSSHITNPYASASRNDSATTTTTTPQNGTYLTPKYSRPTISALTTTTTTSIATQSSVAATPSGHLRDTINHNGNNQATTPMEIDSASAASSLPAGSLSGLGGRNSNVAKMSAHQLLSMDSTESSRSSSSTQPRTAGVPRNMALQAPQNMTFSNLYKLLQQLVQNRGMYESYMGLFFRVQLVKRGGQMHFNIEKNKNYKKKHKNSTSDSAGQGKKYEIVINATFGSNNTPEESTATTTTTTPPQLLACKLPSDLIEPYFAKSPADLRQMSRTDRSTCEGIIDEGGKKVNNLFFSLRFWKATLYPTPDEIFSPSSAATTATTASSSSTYPLGNVMKPILLLQVDDS